MRRLQNKGLARLVDLDRRLWLGELSDAYGPPAVTVNVPEFPQPSRVPSEDAEAMQRAVRSHAMLQAKRHNRDRGYDYTPVLDYAGTTIGWRYRLGLHGYGWVTVDGHVCSEDTASAEEAEAQVRVSYTATTAPGLVVQAARLVHPTAHVFNPVRPPAPDGDGDDQLLGWTFRCLAPEGRYGWVSGDRSVWRAVFTDEIPAMQALRRWHDLRVRVAEAEQMEREAPRLPDLPAQRAHDIAVEAHGAAQEVMPFAPGGRVLGFTYRAEAGFGWVTVFASRALYVEPSSAEAERLVPLAMVQDLRDEPSGSDESRALLVDSGSLNFGAARATAHQQHRRACLFETAHSEHGDLLGWTYAIPNRDIARGDTQYCWVSAAGRAGDLVNDRHEARFCLASYWMTDRAVAGLLT